MIIFFLPISLVKPFILYSPESHFHYNISTNESLSRVDPAGSQNSLPAIRYKPQPTDLNQLSHRPHQLRTQADPQTRDSFTAGCLVVRADR